MTLKEKRKLEKLGWPSHQIRNSTDAEELELQMVLRLGIRHEGPHKYSLWVHTQSVVYEMDQCEQKSCLENKQKLDALAMTILLSHQE